MLTKNMSIVSMVCFEHLIVMEEDTYLKTVIQILMNHFDEMEYFTKDHFGPKLYLTYFLMSALWVINSCVISVIFYYLIFLIISWSILKCKYFKKIYIYLSRYTISFYKKWHFLDKVNIISKWKEIPKQNFATVVQLDIAAVQDFQLRKEIYVIIQFLSHY